MQIVRMRRQGKGGGFTLIELLVVIAILGILAAILFPSLLQARHRSHAAACISKLAQLNLAHQAFMDENDGRLAYSPDPWNVNGLGRWYSLLDPYVALPKVQVRSIFRCPVGRAIAMYGDRPSTTWDSIDLNMIRFDWVLGSNIKNVSMPQRTAAFLDFTSYPAGIESKSTYVNELAAAPTAILRHPGASMNVAFLDGGVRSFPGGALPSDLIPGW